MAEEDGYDDEAFDELSEGYEEDFNEESAADPASESSVTAGQSLHEDLLDSSDACALAPRGLEDLGSGNEAASDGQGEEEVSETQDTQLSKQDFDARSSDFVEISGLEEEGLAPLAKPPDEISEASASPLGSSRSASSVARKESLEPPERLPDEISEAGASPVGSSRTATSLGGEDPESPRRPVDEDSEVYSSPPGSSGSAASSSSKASRSRSGALEGSSGKPGAAAVRHSKSSSFGSDSEASQSPTQMPRVEPVVPTAPRPSAQFSAPQASMLRRSMSSFGSSEASEPGATSTAPAPASSPHRSVESLLNSSSERAEASGGHRWGPFRRVDSLDPEEPHADRQGSQNLEGAAETASEQCAAPPSRRRRSSILRTGARWALNSLYLQVASRSVEPGKDSKLGERSSGMSAERIVAPARRRRSSLLSSGARWALESLYPQVARRSVGPDKAAASTSSSSSPARASPARGERRAEGFDATAPGACEAVLCAREAARPTTRRIAEAQWEGPSSAASSTRPGLRSARMPGSPAWASPSATSVSGGFALRALSPTVEEESLQAGPSRAPAPCSDDDLDLRVGGRARVRDAASQCPEVGLEDGSSWLGRRTPSRLAPEAAVACRLVRCFGLQTVPPEQMPVGDEAVPSVSALSARPPPPRRFEHGAKKRPPPVRVAPRAPVDDKGAVALEGLMDSPPSTPEAQVTMSVAECRRRFDPLFVTPSSPAIRRQLEQRQAIEDQGRADRGMAALDQDARSLAAAGLLSQDEFRSLSGPYPVAVSMLRCRVVHGVIPPPPASKPRPRRKNSWAGPREHGLWPSPAPEASCREANDGSWPWPSKQLPGTTYGYFDYGHVYAEALGPVIHRRRRSLG
mmetsp:Transcript_45121/g.98058  ORF Transcript_45121/g.98058 Transcript_45121/m.98058 type:complete len:864 (-) Transcript_45121:138-2729(-)